MNFLSDCQIISQPAQEISYQFEKMSLVLLNPKHSTAVLLSSPEIFHCEFRKSFAVLFYGNHIMDLMLYIAVVSSINDCLLLFSALRVVLRAMDYVQTVGSHSTQGDWPLRKMMTSAWGCGGMNLCNLSSFSHLQGNIWDMLMRFIFTKIQTKTFQWFKIKSCWCSHSVIFDHRLFFDFQGKTRHSHVSICQGLNLSACYQLFVRVIYAATGSELCHDHIQMPNKKNIC